MQDSDIMTGFIFMDSDAANDYLKVRAPASSQARRLRCQLCCLAVSSPDSPVTGATLLDLKTTNRI